MLAPARSAAYRALRAGGTAPAVLNAANEVAVNDGFVSELDQQKSRVCPLVCQDGYIAQGEACVAKAKAWSGCPASSRNHP